MSPVFPVPSLCLSPTPPATDKTVAPKSPTNLEKIRVALDPLFASFLLLFFGLYKVLHGSLNFLNLLDSSRLSFVKNGAGDNHWGREAGPKAEQTAATLSPLIALRTWSLGGPMCTCMCVHNERAPVSHGLFSRCTFAGGSQGQDRVKDADEVALPSHFPRSSLHLCLPQPPTFISCHGLS